MDSHVRTFKNRLLAHLVALSEHFNVYRCRTWPGVAHQRCDGGVFLVGQVELGHGDVYDKQVRASNQRRRRCWDGNGRTGH